MQHLDKEQNEKQKKSLRRIREAFDLAFNGQEDGSAFDKVFEDGGRGLLLKVLGKDELAEEDNDFFNNTVFGFNIRLTNDDTVVPLLDGKRWQEYKEKAKKNKTNKYEDVVLSITQGIDPEKTIPRLFSSLGNQFQTISFSIKNNEYGKYEITQQSEEEAILDEEIKNLITQTETKSFAVAQKEAFYGGECEDKAWFWISRECNNLENKNGGYLSNILVISEGEIYKSYIKQHHLKFLRFLFKMETAYALIMEKERKIESIKSAVAAIMSRNMSHNLGSHFISNTKNFFEAMIDIDSEHEAVYRGVKNAFQYIQERMDFIATVTSNDTYPYGAVNAKAQIFDELTPDDLGKRHGKKSLNFLMDYLVLSEKVSKNSYSNANTASVLKKGEMNLELVMGYKDDKGVATFWNSEATKETEENHKRDDLVKINFAIPGGILGRHAVFSIVENVIRNAAKHGQEKIKKDLVVKMLCDNGGRFVIFDNKKDKGIKTTVKNLNERLHGIKMLNEDGSLNQDNKGLKEILICAVWLQNGDVAKVIQEKDFDRYVKIMAVDENGKELDESETSGYLGYSIGLERFNRSMFLEVADVENISIAPEKLRDLKADIICAERDYSVGNGTKKLSDVFPRFCRITKKDYETKIKEPGFEADLLCKIIEQNCKIDTKAMQMVVSSNKRSDFVSVVNCPVVFDDDYSEKSKNDFIFKTHAGESKWSKFEALFMTNGFEGKYLDSISGGDFTHTLVQPSFVCDPYNLWKIYESVKTRFVIIDERLFEQYHSPVADWGMIRGGVNYIQEQIQNGKQTIGDLADYVFHQRYLLGQLPKTEKGEPTEEQKKIVSDCVLLEKLTYKDIDQQFFERKGLYLLNFDNMIEGESKRYELQDLSFDTLGHFERDGAKAFFKPDNGTDKFFGPEDQSPLTFLTVHLGLIDKIKGSLCPGGEAQQTFDESSIVEALKDYFGAKFVSIHSGRGGFDVRDSLKKYVFQSFSAVENPLHNSKYLLSQQFYNQQYYGTNK